MKKTVLIFACLFQVCFAFSQNNMGIGTPTPDASALLDLSATDKGFLPPRLTTVQKLAIPNPATGLLVFDISTNSFWYFNGVIWVEALCQQVNPSTGFTHYIGELYGGGIVVSLWKEAGYEHGLIASLTDLSAGTDWSNLNLSATTIGASAQSTTDGQGNSIAIISQTGHISSAALLCDAYSSNGFNDWYLPASWELNQCFNSAFIVNTILGPTNGFTYKEYWSSTEIAIGLGLTYGRAKVLLFDSGVMYDRSKNNISSVRAVRRF